MKNKEVVDYMMKNDAFSQWLGLNVIEVENGRCELEFTVRPEMLNGFYILHGGISYSAADSALAFAANSHGIQSVSIETSISHTKPAKVNEKIKVVAEEMSCSKKLGIYHVTISNEKNEVIALFKGTVYRTGKEWSVN
ncbi:MAG: PaaI family thioesterase [Flavobacteriales bacterium]